MSMRQIVLDRLVSSQMFALDWRNGMQGARKSQEEQEAAYLRTLAGASDEDLLNLSLEDIKKLTEARKAERDRRRNRALRIKKNNYNAKIK